MKGVGILWIVGFHLFQAADQQQWPSPTDGDFAARLVERCNAPLLRAAECWVRGGLAGVVLVGFHAVSVFLVLSGLGLAYALGDAPAPRTGWVVWYRRRFLRLYPLYWVAHLVVAISPFVVRPEPIDWRFWLSLTGLRVWRITEIHYYLNPAWWYFVILIQLVACFPLLWGLQRRLGPTGFAVGTFLLAGVTRWLLLFEFEAIPFWGQGAFGLSRVAEFGFGMALGVQLACDPARMTALLFQPVTLAVGIVVYGLGLASYHGGWTYAFTDALLGYGLFIVMAHAAGGLQYLPRLAVALGLLGSYSYGLYLFHQPYVLYVGERLGALPLAPALGCALVLICCLALGSSAVERTVNRLVDRLAT